MLVLDHRPLLETSTLTDHQEHQHHPETLVLRDLEARVHDQLPQLDQEPDHHHHQENRLLLETSPLADHQEHQHHPETLVLRDQEARVHDQLPQLALVLANHLVQPQEFNLKPLFFLLTIKISPV
jgi:hypothetical protein